ncbi:hypothetical protein [Verrucomicrobium sp. GAS474]|uniref:hypothetical protein n=1 Tax=Verrucomicrobium sp. GAS474 TaxID=1882831 RepID=UPI000B8A2718|nr:hypothetical protein [Verrucomicrobium sp. GAS474]
MRATDLTVDQIVAKGLEKSEADEKNLSRFEYHQKVTFDKIKANGEAESVSNLEMQVSPGAQSEFTVVGQAGKVTEEQQKQARLSQKFKMTFSLRKMAPRFNVKLDGKETWDGRAVYRIAFSPKPDQPFNNRVEKISNHFVGFMWFAADDYTLLRAKAHLDAPVDMAWVLAEMEALDFSYDSCAVPGGAAPSKFLIDYRLGFVVGELHNRNEITTSDFKEKAAAPVAGKN